ncbi:MAG TPA: tRNA (adenosine(37)-N6)-dimethylallyltransferase MiaA [Usitatibacter sp.]|nr:tRNA (adenosine(37)-N6)-dimethylallyltransferase MiaA [Usitatibacter sp.]
MKAVFLLGPTASGKSALALALAERFPAEIVSVDSAQVYRGMDIGTAKPDRATLARVPHHLVDIVDPVEAYSAGRFRADAERAIAQIHARGRLPIVAGGTMLYFRALLVGLADLPPAQPAIRERSEARAAREGWPALHAELARIDPESASRIEPTDAQRIQRALEVHEHTGTPLSAHHRAAAARLAQFEALALSLEPSDRSMLHARIAERFRAMLAAGLVEELEGLRARFGLEAGMPSMRTVGYRQAWETLEGRAPAATLEARGIAATRQLAKRQLTWLRAMGTKPGTQAVERFDALRPDLAAAVIGRLSRFLDAKGPRDPGSR